MAMPSISILIVLVAARHTSRGFTPFGGHGRTRLEAKQLQFIRRASTNGENDLSSFDRAFLEADDERIDSRSSSLLFEDPEMIEFEQPTIADKEANNRDGEKGELTSLQDYLPSVQFLRESGRYISDHREECVVIHIPGEFIENKGFSRLVDDIALCWLLGLKIVMVVGGRFHRDCRGLSCDVKYSCEHEYHNAIHATDKDLLRNVQEEAGYVRFEVERILNKSLRLHASMGSNSHHAPILDGFVTSGNFYTAGKFGVVNGKDYMSTGYPKKCQVEKIQRALSKNDIVLLTPVGTNHLGELVNVNSNHLAAFVAASLSASKVIYFSSTATPFLRSKKTKKKMLDISLSCSKQLVQHHGVQVFDAGFATFDKARESLNEETVEKLLLLGWSNWALENGVKRAHVVGPTDGSLLEELFTSMDGTNTCVRQENDYDDLEYELKDDQVDTLGPLPPYLGQ